MSLVELDLSGHVAVVQLNDPARRNALSRDMVAELIATFDAIQAAKGVRAVVLCAQGSAFCAGADRALLADATAPADARAVLASIYEGFLRVARCEVPTIAAVDGPAVGAGMNLALACDLRIAGPRASFDPRFVQLGLHPGGGHTWLLQRLVSTQSAAAAVLFGQTLDAKAAWRSGLIFEIVASEGLTERARALAGRAAEGDRELLERVKATMADTRELHSLDEAVAREFDDQIWSITRSGSSDRLGGR
ncbi:MAG TPA: enoyl-CoA hydratase-related protein [Acidimicrobiales bacterium]|nr:enoyl-CoA hydratase-related protein [Acidimicrobiales bacterium]